jgi:hypothetical protein
MMSDVALLEGTECSERIHNPYYDAWKRVESYSFRLGLAYSHYSNRLFQPGLSEQEKETCWREISKINAWVTKYTQKYSWAIPNGDVLQEIAKYTPLVEIGAGTGYWAWLLRQLGIDILAFDKCPPGPSNTSKNEFHPQADTWTEVLPGDEFVLDSINNRSLFLCWPPSHHAMAFETLSRFRGNTFLFVGEGWPSRATGDEQFFELLRRDWVLTDDSSKMTIPQWPGRKDFLWVYRRKLRR